MFAKSDGFSEVDIEGALATKVQKLDDTFDYLNLTFDEDTYKIMAMGNETLALTNILL